MARKKPSKPAAPTNPLARLELLGDETLLAILDCLDTRNVLTMRITNSAFTPPCNSILADRLKRLYILPTIPSLQKALKLAKHPFFHDKIEEVVLLGEQHLRELEKLSYPPRRDMGPGYYHPTRKILDRPFATWPSAQEVQAFYLDGQPSDLTLLPSWAQNALQPLSAVLERLPNLKKLTFLSALGDSYSGFNGKTQDAITAHAKKYLNIPESKTSLSIIDTVARKDNDPFRNTDAEVLFATLVTTKARITELELDTELPYVPHIVYSLAARGTFSYAAQSKMSALRTVRLTFDSGWHRTDWHVLWGGVLSFCDNLEELHLRLKANSAVKGGGLGRTLRDLIRPLYFEKLHTLDIRMVPLESDKDKLQRPQCEYFNMGCFLTWHKESLKVVHFDNVFFAQKSEKPMDTMNGILRQIWEEEGELKAGFTWLINSYTHSLSCKEKGVERTCESAECFRYDVSGSRDLQYLTTWEGIVYFMKMLGVKTAGDGKDTVWELGGLMRAVKEEWHAGPVA